MSVPKFFVSNMLLSVAKPVIPQDKQIDIHNIIAIILLYFIFLYEAFTLKCINKLHSFELFDITNNIFTLL